MYNIHWKPLSLICRVCELTYTHIIHYENLHQEWQQFLLDSELREKLELPWRNRVRGNGSHARYLDLITPSKKIKLYEKFSGDFLMFGYDISDEI